MLHKANSNSNNYNYHEKNHPPVHSTDPDGVRPCALVSEPHTVCSNGDCSILLISLKPLKACGGAFYQL